MHPVAVLIESVKAVEECSDVDLAARAASHGFTISKSRIAQIRNQPVKSVSPDNIATLAAALNVPPRRVIKAYLQAMGFDLDLSIETSVEDAIRADTRLSSDDKETLLALTRSFRGRRPRLDGVADGASGSGGTNAGDGERKSPRVRKGRGGLSKARQE